jgi:hypothetical protein
MSLAARRLRQESHELLPSFDAPGIYGKPSLKSSRNLGDKGLGKSARVRAIWPTMLPMTLQFIIVMIAFAINDRLQGKLDYVEEERRILQEQFDAATGGKLRDALRTGLGVEIGRTTVANIVAVASGKSSTA